MLPDVCTRAEVGRITGRGNTANLESVIALKPDLILDVGSTSATFVSLAESVQQQTNIPYALLDGRFDAVAETYRKLGELTGGKPMRKSSSVMPRIRSRTRLVVSQPPPPHPSARLLRARAAWAVTGLGVRSTSRRSKCWRKMSRGKIRAASRMSRSSRFFFGIRMSSSRLTRISRQACATIRHGRQ